MITPRWLPLMLPFALACLARADGPGDNLQDKVRTIPPRGITLTDADRAELQAGVGDLGKEIERLRGTLRDKRGLLDLLPDVQIFHNAVRYALTYQEFFKPQEVSFGKKLLQQGLERARQLGQGQAPWIAATGLVLRGYVSHIDGSVQPYGLVVPASYGANSPHRFRLDVWCHGRMETLSEVNFLRDRQSSPGEFVPRNAFVLHPYGRFCNANRFAGEVDLFEALEHIKQHYPIDEDRLVMRGFSMGGAACWQFATHHPDRWVAAAPGAGFSEVPEFLRVFQNEVVQPPPYERKLWHLYDSTDYALNLFNCPTVAYSGANDRQKQAADMMAKALAAERIDLVHIIGAGAGHHYTPEARAQINGRIDNLAEAGRDPVPGKVHFTTWTLRYNRSFWVQVDGLEQHWERARVDAELHGGKHHRPSIKTHNVSALTLRFPAGRCPFDIRQKPRVELDGADLEAPQPLSDRSWEAHFRKVAGAWTVAASVDDGTLRKRHGLQGPIDDAFMDSFLIIRPTGQAQHPAVGKWTAAEMQHALDHWRRQFRGEARVKDDRAVTDADLAAHHLILWGDPGSNRLLARIADRLPIRWTSATVQVGDQSFPADHHVPALVYPNPLRPGRYIVLNSGFTYREYDYLNNARQVPKLPDFAVIDVNVPATSRAPGGIVMAGFFNERWQLPSKSP
jgi:pimeloyl-ACP methyl ester carboxylesterase